MKNTKLVRILASLSTKEVKRLQEQSNLALSKSNSKAASLLQTLLKYHPDFPEKRLQKELIYRAAFPNKTFDGNYLRKQSSLLFSLTQDFLIDIKNQNDEFTREKALLSQLRERKLFRLFNLKMQSIKKEKRESNLRDSQYYQQQFELAEEADLYFGQLQERRFDKALQEKTDNLDAYYFAKKLKESCEMLNRSKIIAGNYDMRMTEEIIKILSPENPLSEIPPIKLYLQIFLSLKEEENEEHFHKLRQLLEENYSYFSQKEAVGMYRYARNYCIRKINTGNRTYLQFLLDLYKKQLDSKVLLTAGILSDDDYKNIITVGMQLGEKKWVFNFLHSYKEHLRPAQKENVFNYNLAVYYYGTKDYNNAIELLNTVKFTDAYYEINGKIILLKTYFIQKEFQAFYYLLDAFKLSLMRNKKVANNYRNAISNFLVQFKKIVKLIELKDFTDEKNFNHKREKIEQRLQESSVIYDKDWLLKELRKIS